MQNQNMSDLIEEYLKQVLNAQEHVEIRRSEIADQFKCVPSQINYVIKTRFTLQQGYLVESKRGGGGYIRIAKVTLAEDVEIINSLLDLIQETVTAKQAFHIIQNLYENGIISKREAEVMLVATDQNVLGVAEEKEDKLRSYMMIEFLNNLKYESL